MPPGHGTRSLAILRLGVSSVACLLLSLLLCNCTTPIAPAYRIEKESREIQFVPGTPPAIRIGLAYTLQNYGSSRLDYLDVTLPPVSTYGRTNLQAQLDGSAAPLQELPPELRLDLPNRMRLDFASGWKPGEKKALAIQYWFRSPGEPGERITLDESDFHISSRRGFAALNPPSHALSPYPSRPAKMYYTVSVPEGFRVLARGKLASRKRSAGGLIYRYLLTSSELAPFVVSGRYVELAPIGSSGPVFWTFEPVAVQPDVAKEIADAWSTLENDYGPLDKNIRTPHIVEASHLPVHMVGEQGPAAAPFSGGALVDSSAIADAADSGARGGEFIEAVSHALAHNWFGDQIYPAPNASIGIGEGLPEYATIVIDAARGGEAARRKRIAQYLSEYDAAAKEGTENALAVSSLTDPEPQRQIALAKAPLFFAALEDECGTAAMQSALKQVVTLLRGKEVGYPVILAALEQESGKKLAPTFRLWLNEKGIPHDFRQRYAGSSASENGQ